MHYSGKKNLPEVKNISSNITQPQDTSFLYQKKFQNYIDALVEHTNFDINEESFEPIMMKTEKELREYVSFLIKLKYPQAQFSTIYVSEDRTKKIWFAYTRIENVHRRNNFQIIICKDNGKVLWFKSDS